VIVGQKRTVRGRYLSEVRVCRETKDGGCPVFSLRCRGTCLDHETLKQEEQEGEGEVDGFLISVFGDGDLNGFDGDGGGDGDGPGKRDNRIRQT
jgi:hypothetical protein